MKCKHFFFFFNFIGFSPQFCLWILIPFFLSLSHSHSLSLFLSLSLSLSLSLFLLVSKKIFPILFVNYFMPSLPLEPSSKHSR